MGNPKINDCKLLLLIDKNNLSQSDAARKLGVSRQAVSHRLQELRGKTTRIVAAKKTEKMIERKLHTIEQLQKINVEANKLLDALEDNPGLKIKVMAEIRNQLKLQLEIFQTLYSLQAAEDFQNSVMEAIREVSPDVREAIIRKLNEKQAIRSALKFA